MDSILSFLVPIILVVLVLLVLAANVRVVPQSRAFVIERLGAFQGVWGVGLHFKIPFIERVAKNVSLKEQVVDFPPQPVITKDNVTMQIDTVIYFQITDPKLYTYGVENPMSAIENLTATTLRNIIGDLELDQSLTSRDHINGQMRAILDEATDNWGIKVNRVELKNIMPPRDIQESMEKQMRAERERRESILQAEGQKQSQILVAEGEKQSAILRADAAKQAAILQAEGAKQAKILEAEAQAQAIMKVQQATADAIKLINEANPGDGVLKIKALEALDKVGILDKAFVRADQLSGGQQQRVALARTLAQNPQIILADEPVASLDPVTAKQVMDDFLRINQEMKITVLINIHHVELALQYASRVVGIRSGEIVYDGPASQVDEAVLDAIYQSRREERV